MVRTLADWNPGKYHSVIQWPCGEALAAYEARMKRNAERNHTIAYIAWVVAASHGSKAKAPKLPEILKD